MKKKDDQQQELLKTWQTRLSTAQTAYKRGFERMERQEQLYQGTREVKPLDDTDEIDSTPHTWNIGYELVESQVSADIPSPKVIALRKRDEPKAKMIEDMLRNKIEELKFEQHNDLAERVCPSHGGLGWLVEWDASRRTHTTTGETRVTMLHPKMMLPQPGVYSGIEDMDYFITVLPQTKSEIKRRYGVDVFGESETEPEVRSSDADTSEDMVTLYVGYSRGQDGCIDKFSWVGDTVVEDIPDYLARRVRSCVRCGTPEPPDGEDLLEPTLDGNPPGGELPEAEVLSEPGRADHRPGGKRRKACPFCGGTKWKDAPLDYEEITIPVSRNFGLEPLGPTMIQEAQMGMDDMGLPLEQVGTQSKPLRIPTYKPKGYPIVLQKNVSVYGRFLGKSDLDVIEDQQLTINRTMRKILDRTGKQGTIATVPENAVMLQSTQDMLMYAVRNAAEAALFQVKSMDGDISQLMAILTQAYEEARSMLGVNDSSQGKRDPTATSGVAKEFQASRTAGRLESRRILKEAAYAEIFRLIFQFELAYADEPRPVRSKDIHGRVQYSEFNRYDFLEQDEAGEWFWNDLFLFSVDNTAPLASNREAMWQETRMNLESGAFGDPTKTETLLMFWEKMAVLHYPDAENTVQMLRERLEEERQQQMMAMQMQQQQMQMQQAMGMAQQLREGRSDGNQQAAAPEGAGV